MDDNLMGSLREIYRPERIFTKEVQISSEDTIVVTFVFPSHERTREPIDHISGLQIHEALYEGFVLLLEHARNKFNHSNFQTANVWEDRRSLFEINPIAVEEHFYYRKRIRSGEEATVTFKIREMHLKRVRRQWLAVTIDFKGPVCGSTEVLLPVPTSR